MWLRPQNASLLFDVVRSAFALCDVKRLPEQFTLHCCAYMEWIGCPTIRLAVFQTPADAYAQPHDILIVSIAFIAISRCISKLTSVTQSTVLGAHLRRFRNSHYLFPAYGRFSYPVLTHSYERWP